MAARSYNHTVGAPLKLDQAKRNQVLEALRRGATRYDAASLVGVDRSTLYRARQADADFDAAVLQAEGQAAQKALDVIWAAIEGGDAKTASWWLEHRRPRQWGDKTTGQDNDRNEDQDGEIAFLLR
ncbi:MAG TPA: hypothetical protein VFB50_23775 [Chloroflexota bacterium]|nr:hypothetical protein [Chloroflexota bacterium]